MYQFECSIAEGLWRALETLTTGDPRARGGDTQPSFDRVLRYRDHVIYQVSITTALVESGYQGAMRIANLREHGDLGLGTFEALETINLSALN